MSGYAQEKYDDLPLFAQPKHLDHVPHEPVFRSGSLRKRAENWIRENPKVAELFLRFAKEMAAKERRFSVSLLTERVRYEVAFEWNQDFKINNSYRAYIARWLIAEDPRLEAWMTFRKVNY